MTTRHLRSGYDWIGIGTGWGLVALGLLVAGMAWLGTTVDAVVASPGYLPFGLVLSSIGVALLLISIRNGVTIDKRGIRVVRPLRRAVWVSWPEVDHITVIGRGAAFAAHAIILTDGTRVLTPLTERDRRLPRLWRQIALRRDSDGGGTTEVGPLDDDFGDTGTVR